MHIAIWILMLVLIGMWSLAAWGLHGRRLGRPRAGLAGGLAAG